MHMNRIHRASFLVVLMAVLSLPAIAGTRGRAVVAPSTPTVPTAKFFAPTEKEAYLSDDVLAYIRPGLQIKVNSVALSSGKVTVDLSLTDAFDQPIDRLGKTTPGAVSLSYILAWYDPATRQYTSYTTRAQTSAATSPHPNVTAIQAGTDSGGTTTDLETGHVKYLFKTVLPAGFDTTKTTTLGIYATRNMTDTIGKNYFANLEYDFRPDGNTVTDKWDKINQNTSCQNCHDPKLAAHGGSRQDVKLCALCHQPQTVDPDTGNTVDLKVMIHKIHDGANLPSVKAGIPYQIIGNANSLHDFSNVALPPGQDVRNCVFCHEGSDPKAKPAQNDVWYTKPSRLACGSCHDDLDFATGKNHAGGIQADDKACASCHVPDSGKEFDASVKGAHVLPIASRQLKGLTATIVNVTNAAPGKKPTVVFALKNGDGTAVDGSKLATFAPIMAGPTTSYTTFFRESGVPSATNTNVGVFDAAAGTTTYTFTNPIPANQTGTWAFTADITRNVTLKQNNGKADLTQREAAFNNITYAAITGTTATPRRTSVVLSQCNSCHNILGLHGGQRQNTQECVICHNPTNSDVAQRPAAEGQPESISFQRLIHRIHRGEGLTQDFTVFGNGKSRHNYNEVVYPGTIDRCVKCHTATGYTLPLPTGIDSVTTLRDYYTPQGPATAACLGCHDNRDAAAHAFLNTTTFPGATVPAEACATCHGTGKDWAVDKVHAQ
jgi:OmcA/MtrC family decaheme c-type cytochrome